VVYARVSCFSGGCLVYQVFGLKVLDNLRVLQSSGEDFYSSGGTTDLSL